MKILYETDRLIVKEWETKDFRDLYEYVKDVEAKLNCEKNCL